MLIVNLIQRKTGLRKKGLHSDTLDAMDPPARTTSTTSQRQLPPAALRMRDVARADAAAERFEANALAVATAMSLADAAETPASNSESY